MILDSLYIKATELKGWCVFTRRALKAGTIIESSPVIVMTAAEKDLLNQTHLYNYIFDWQNDECCMAMGYIPIYNHAMPSNCEYFQEYEEGTIFIKTVRDIMREEELTINYNGDYNNAQSVWFDVRS